jgi:hypothetical protein
MSTKTWTVKMACNPRCDIRTHGGTVAEGIVDPVEAMDVAKSYSNREHTVWITPVHA